MKKRKKIIELPEENNTNSRKTRHHRHYSFDSENPPQIKLGETQHHKQISKTIVEFQDGTKYEIPMQITFESDDPEEYIMKEHNHRKTKHHRTKNNKSNKISIDNAISNEITEPENTSSTINSFKRNNRKKNIIDFYSSSSGENSSDDKLDDENNSNSNNSETNSDEQNIQQTSSSDENNNSKSILVNEKSENENGSKIINILGNAIDKIKESFAEDISPENNNENSSEIINSNENKSDENYSPDQSSSYEIVLPHHGGQFEIAEPDNSYTNKLPNLTAAHDINVTQQNYTIYSNPTNSSSSDDYSDNPIIECGKICKNLGSICKSVGKILTSCCKK